MVFKTSEKNEIKVTDYNFSPLRGSNVIKEDAAAKNYNFSPLDEAFQRAIPDLKKELHIERKNAKTSGFKISPIVMQHRGLKDQEDSEIENLIQQEVEKRIQAIQEEAAQRGYEDGVQAGREEVFDATKAQIEEKIASLSSVVSDVLASQVNIFQAQKKQIYQLILTLTKWVILRELKDDGTYVERLLEKLILEMQTRSNLLIQVNADNFAKMPEVIETIEKKFGQLTNVRVEIAHDMQGPGMVLECDNGIINGEFQEQMKGLEKLFEQVLCGGET